MEAGGGYWFLPRLSLLLGTILQNGLDLSTATVRHLRGEAKRWRQDPIGKRATRESSEGCRFLKRNKRNKCAVSTMILSETRGL